MKLNVNFSGLHQCVKKMGAKETDFHIDIHFDPIDIELDSGIDIQLSDLEFTEGILSYQGRQVLLYIPDQGANISKVLEYPETGRKFHVADCSTLKQMRDRNRFDRYIVTNNLSGYFKVNGINSLTNQHHEGDAELKVCKNCLKALNYDGYANKKNNRDSIFNNFKIDKFFETFSTVFKYLPKKIQGVYEPGYSKDWDNISRQYRESRRYICETCNTDFSNHKNLLHTHHISGVKDDNSKNNLKALCADCHKKEPMHKHIFIHHNDMLQIYELRRNQGNMNIQTWDDVFKFADTSLHGYLQHARENNSVIPDIGYPIELIDKKIIVDVAWRKKKIAVVISKNPSHDTILDWKILSLGSEMNRLATRIKG